MPLPPLAALPAHLVSSADYERAARDHLDDNAWAYLQGGAADELTLAANRRAFDALGLWPRPLRRLPGGHTRLCLLGQAFAHPLLLAPLAWQRLFHAEGELATVRAAAVTDTGIVVSTLASTPLADIARAARAPLWFQLYWQGDRARTEALLHLAVAAGYQAVVFTVDAPVAGIRNREQRLRFALPPGVAAVNLPPSPPPPAGLGNLLFDHLMATAPAADDLAWLCAHSPLPVLVKGLLHPADAAQAMAAGAAGVIVSNHGGRVLDGAPTAIAALPAVVAAVAGRGPVLLDSGIRRGSDAFKALALGATAVLVGRPAMHALAVAGALGVAHLLRTLREELEITMALCGCATLADIGPDCLWQAPSPS
ncbi:MAG: alpha-hydroxy acid oxidase [Moraxellaceae bacterium]